MSDHERNLSADDERKLRALLKRDTPHLAVPGQWMAAVRRKVVRNRRLRAAGLLAGTLTAMTIVFVMVQADQQHAERATVAAPPEDRNVVLPLTGRREPYFGNGSRYGLVLALPGGWSARSGRNGHGPVGYAANYPLGAAPECQSDLSPAFTCAPSDRLPLGGTLVEFEVLTPATDGLEITRALELRDVLPAPKQRCRERGGVSAFATTAVKISDRSAVRASVCLAPRTEGAKTAEPGPDVRTLLASVRLAASDSP
ncbi:hypothetical protein [Streptomyces sp. NPDC052721]|uniref:hypothetical protein n=1 Tax=Streptomyces sp. NPDC052721 TaxID=3154955 RepID=UPI00343180AA